MDTVPCEICDVGTLTCHTEMVMVEYLGQQGKIESRYSLCDYCGSAQASADELLFNKEAMLKFKERVEEV